TVTGLQRGVRYFAGLWATDTAGHDAGPSLTSAFTAGRDTVFLYVATTGSNNGTEGDRADPWDSIQRAINAIPGNLIQQETYYVVEVLDSGRYEEKVTLNRTADESYSVTVRPAIGQAPTIVGPNNKDAVLIRTAYAVLTGFHIEAGEKVGVIVNSADGVTLADLIIDGNGNTAGIRLVEAGRTRIHDVRINDPDIGIHLGKDADNNSVRNVLVLGDGSGTQGIYFDQNTDADSLVNVSIIGFAQGLAFRGGGKAAGDNHVVRNCIIHDVGTAIELDKALGQTFGVLDYNDLHPVAGGHVGNIEGADFTTLTDWRDETGLDTHSMSLNPRFIADAVAPASMDLHVASQAGRWDGSNFVSDVETSPAIDAGDPRDSFAKETAPNGNRVNLGAWGNTAEASRSGGVSLVQGGLPWATYLLAGVPVTPGDPSPDAVLSDDFLGENGENIWGEWVRVVRWDTAQNAYVYYEEDLGAAGSPPDLLPGRGFWLIQWWSIIDGNGNASGDSVTVDGTLVSNTEDFVLPLTVSGSNGFNQLANPFVFDIDWANTRVRDVDSGTEWSIADAAERELIDGHAYLWDWAEQTYLPIQADTGGRIKSWGGFWVEQLVSDRRLELLIPPVEATVSLNKTLQSRASPTDWFVEFSVEGVAQVPTASGIINVVLRDPNNRAGVHADASRRWDPLDALDLTGLRQPYLYVYFPHGDSADPQTYWPDRPNRYTYDLRDPDWLEQTWEFVVETQAVDTELTWVWTNPGAIPSGYRISLEDALADTVIRADISATPAQRFQSGPQGLRRFRLRAVYEDIVGDVDGNRTVAADDARQVLRHVVGLEVIAEFALAQARVRLSGAAAALTPLDAAWILRYAQGLVATLPVSATDLQAPSLSAKSVHLSAPEPQRDGSWMIPVYIDDAAGLLSGTMQLTWDPQQLTLTSIKPGAGLRGYEGAFVETGEGRALYAFAGASSRDGRQVLADVQIQPLLVAADLIDHLTITAVELNDGQ
ncbi:MAG: right-handed parallel beta-helix repeat-containing protein, partial [bacterium]|nr:right-handed parallel beta-helix repeat-containing protein [bacterium]